MADLAGAPLELNAAKAIAGIWLLISVVIMLIVSAANVPLASGNMTTLLFAILSLPFALPLVVLALVGIAGLPVIAFLALFEFAGGIALIAWSDD